MAEHYVGVAETASRGFDQAVRGACANDPLTAELMDCMLTPRLCPVGPVPQAACPDGASGD